MNKHLRYVGDQAECHKLAGTGIALANTVENIIVSLGVENIEREFQVASDARIRVKCNKDSAIITIYAEPKGYSMKSGLLRSGKIVSGSNGKMAAKDFRDSQYAFQMKHDAWVAGGSVGDEPVREYYNVEDLSFIKEANSIGHGYPIPSRYTGLMATAIEFAIGANRIVETSHGWFQTDGIYRDGDTDWMVRINPSGAYAKKIEKLDGKLFPGYEDKINNSTLGYVPKELIFPTGQAFGEALNNGSVIKLSGSTGEFYDSCWSSDYMNNMGWCFNSTGHSACNISIKNWRTGVSSKNLNMSRVIVASISINSSSKTGSISLAISEQNEVTTLVIPYGVGGPCGPIVQYSGMTDEFGDDLKLETGGFFWDLNLVNAGGELYRLNGKGWHSGGSSEIGSYEFPVWCAYINDTIVVGRIGYENIAGSSNTTGTGEAYEVVCPDGTHVVSGPDAPRSVKSSIVTDSYSITMRYKASIAGIAGQPLPDRTHTIETTAGCVDGGFDDVESLYAIDEGPYFAPHPPYFYKTGSAWWKVQSLSSQRAEVNIYNTTCQSKIGVSMSHTDRLAFFIKRPSAKTTHIYPDIAYTYIHKNVIPGGSSAYYPQNQGLSPGVCNPYVANINWIPGSTGGFMEASQFIKSGFVNPSGLAYRFTVAPPGNDCYAVVSNHSSSEPSVSDQTGNMHNKYGASTGIVEAPVYHIAGGATIKYALVMEAPKVEYSSGADSYSTYSKMQNVMYVNGEVSVVDTHQDTQFVEIYIPGFGYYRYMDGLQFVSYRCSQNSSKVASNYHLSSGNMDASDNAANSIQIIESSSDGEVYVDWHTRPDRVPSSVAAKRCNYVRLTGDSIAHQEPGTPAYDEAVRQYELREQVNRQFFGPYIWCGPQ